MYTVYVLQNQDGLLYKGYTKDLEARLKGHQSGKNSWTRTRGPWQLIYSEKHESKREAILREKFLKSGKGREFLKNTINPPASA